ncbi:MAG: hypothetical protein ABW137_26095 [Mycobacterium sp.]
MNWMTVVANAIVPIVSVVSSAAVAIWTKRLDARNRRDDRRHERTLDFEKRAADDKKAVLKALISATLYVKRGAQYTGTADGAEVDRRRAEAIGELYEFRMRLGLDDGVAELMIYAAPPVREMANLLLDEWDRQFRERGYSLTQLDSCKRQLAQTAVDVPPPDESTVYFGGERKWSELKKEEIGWLERLGSESDLDLDALVDLCDRTLEVAHRDLRGGYGFEY